MKKRKVTLSIIIAACIMFCFGGCSQKEPSVVKAYEKMDSKQAELSLPMRMQYRKDKVEMVPKNAVEKMISERDAWKAVYAKSFSLLLK